MMGLSAKQQRFVEEYLKDPQNPGTAYKLAGYKASGHSADVNASRLLKKASVKAEIAEAQKQIRQKTLVSVEFVVEGLKEVAQRCMQRVPVMSGSGKDRKQAKTVEGEGVWEFDSGGANRAFELLGKHVGAFSESADDDAPPVQRVEIVIKDGRKA